MGVQTERQLALSDILCLANRLSRALDACSADCRRKDISSLNARILTYIALHEDDGVFQRDLEEALSLQRSTVSRVVARMERKGLVQRERVAWDGRLRRLTLTDHARSIQRVTVGEFSQLENRVTAGLDDREIAALRSLLLRISERV